jgi:endo-1,4-beta-xylanase
MELDRRTLLAGIAAATLPAFASAAEESLASVARRRGMHFGSEMGSRTIERDPAYAALVLEQCSAVVPGNELKWTTIRPDATTINYAPGDALVAWGEQNKLLVRGHNLFWPKEFRSPKWQATFDWGANPHATAEKMLVDHIATTCRRYGARIQSWDVVNEGIEPETGLPRQNSHSKAFGDTVEMIELAFHAAKDNLPAGTELVYNDFMSWEPTHEKHRAGVLKLLEGFRKRNVPVESFGIQGHLGGGGTTGNGENVGGFGAHDERAWRKFLDEVSAMGFRMLITEFDINDRFAVAPIPERDAAVAAYGKAFLDVCLSYPQLHTVMVWGLADNRSWLQGTGARPDGLPKRPCPYDAQYMPKPFREAVAASIAAAPPRSLPKASRRSTNTRP